MFKPVPMLKLNALVLERHQEVVTRALGTTGCLHLVQARSQSAIALLQEPDPAGELRRVGGLLSQCEAVMAQLGVPHAAATAHPEPPAGDPALTLQAIAPQVEGAAVALLRCQDALVQLDNRRSYLSTYAGLLGTIRVEQLRGMTHLFVAMGSVPEAAVPALRERTGGDAMLTVGSLPGREPASGRGNGVKTVPVLMTAHRDKRAALETVLAGAGFTSAPMPPELTGTCAEELVRVEAEQAALRRALAEHQRRMTDLRTTHAAALTAIRAGLDDAQAVAQASRMFGRAARLVWISGWVPQSSEARVRNAVAAVTDELALLRFTRPAEDPCVRRGQDVVPVQFVDQWMLRPFQRLLAIYGLPRYEDVEPSLFLGLTFVLMFGMMFGDVGQGLVLALGGAVLSWHGRARPGSLATAGTFLLFCGLAATGFGILYGSVFGLEGWLPPRWLAPMRGALTLFAAALAVGVLCMSAGVVVNLVNALRRRQFLDASLGKFGVAGLLFYWGCAGLIVKAALTGRLAAWELLLAAGLPLAGVFLRAPLHAYLRRRRHAPPGENGFMLVVMAVLEVFETATMFMSNTVSFIRVGAFALSHAALCMATYILADMVRNLPGGGLYFYCVAVLGNILVIGLEGFISTIQCVRLEYYEVFSKFLAGDGVAFAPFRLAPASDDE